MTKAKLSSMTLRAKPGKAIAMSPALCRAAREFLNWSRAELAARAFCSVGTIRNFELGLHALHINNHEAIRRAFEDAGIKFLKRARNPRPKPRTLSP